MTPTPKSPALDNLFKAMGFDRVGAIKAGKCATCGCDVGPAFAFRDELSAKEYTISGMCQKCQDETFVDED